MVAEKCQIQNFSVIFVCSRFQYEGMGWSHFSEGLYRRDLSQIRILGANCHFR